MAKVPREIIAVSRTTKYTTAVMQWNKREHPFRFGGVGASILNRRSGELFKRLYREYSFCLANRNVYPVVPQAAEFTYFFIYTGNTRNTSGQHGLNRGKN